VKLDLLIRIKIFDTLVMWQAVKRHVIDNVACWAVVTTRRPHEVVKIKH